MVFLCCRVKFPIIYANSPPCDGSLKDEFVLTILNDRHASLFGRNLDRAYPLTMRHGIDDPGVQELKDLFFNNLSRRIV